MTLNTVALELVPPNVERGPQQALEDARKVVQFSAESGNRGTACKHHRNAGRALPYLGLEWVTILPRFILTIFSDAFVAFLSDWVSGHGAGTRWGSG